MPGFAAGVAVVEIKVADHRAVGEGGQVCAAAFTAAEDGRRLRAGDGGGLLASDAYRFAVVAANGAAECIDNQAFGLMHYRRGQVFVAERGRPGGQLVCEMCHHGSCGQGLRVYARWRCLTRRRRA